jgi:cbb3-type cytochrome oxidase subunit 3
MKKINYYLVLVLCCFLIFFVCQQVFALDVGLQYGTETGLAVKDVRVTIAEIVRTTMGILGLIVFVLLILGGIFYLFSHGDPEKENKAKKIIITALIGLFIIILAYFLANFTIRILLEATGPQQPAGIVYENENLIGNENTNQPTTYNCTGLTPANATLCADDDTGLTVDTAKTVVASCTAETKCEYTCPLDFNIVNNNCVNGDPSLPSNYQAYYSFTIGANALPTNLFDGTVLKNDLTPDPSAIANGNLNLDGSHFVRVNNFSISPSFTAIARVKSDTEFWNAHGWIVSTQNANGFIIHPNAYTATDKSWSGYIYDKTGSRSNYKHIGTYNLPAGFNITDWHTYGLQYDNNAQTAKMIFDGQVVRSQSIPIDRGVSDNNIILDIGHDIFASGARFGKGQIDWVYIYNYAVY